MEKYFTDSFNSDKLLNCVIMSDGGVEKWLLKFA